MGDYISGVVDYLISGVVFDASPSSTGADAMLTEAGDTLVTESGDRLVIE